MGIAMVRSASYDWDEVSNAFLKPIGNCRLLVQSQKHVMPVR